jgi:hypothetical protein
MALLSTKLIKSRKKVFDKLRKKSWPATTEIVLLKQSETTREFDQIEILYDSWKLDYEGSQHIILEVAKDDPDGVNLSFEEATHLSVDGDVYVIRTGDTLRPKGIDRVTWKLFGDLFPERAQFKSLY